MEQLICKNLSVGYDGKEILHDLSFTVHAGDYLCIVGENGSGKSTLMKTILGLHAPSSGEICRGAELKTDDIGYLPQQTVVQKDFPATVYEIVLSGNQAHCGIRPFYTKEQKQTAEKNIERMGITALRNRSYRTLSGGQQQRVLLARALCATEKILLLDEPVSGLDPDATAQMYGLVSDLNKSGTTVIMISHDIDAVLSYASHILCLGKTVFFGTKDEFIARKEAGEL